ncbi:3-oxoacyl-(acyl-carrier-protein) synthase [Streptococcus equinus]|uniref:beta-ketoacyl synthase N-terminal-like domain-containing protein n=1 Tax=Streptococcus equinus TaxID=1335 RepID=UPI0008715B87|nr:beta-ketoacyl synthase N-terminal-like domain-containing protein [Streptococcus equinus]SCW48495.1 3-oxoacyl-(acyl-carrier-protein) synthase [Streptococcus equinus]
MSRYVVTGYGVILPHISTTDELWDILVHESREYFDNQINYISLDDMPSFYEKYPFIEKKKLKHSDLQVIFNYMALKECVEKANLLFLLKQSQNIRNKVGIVSGSMFAQLNFGLKQIEKLIIKKSTKISPYTGMAFYFGSNVGEISCLLGTMGENCASLSGTSLVLDGIDIAESMIDYNRNEIVLVGGSENIKYELVAPSLYHNGKINYSSGHPYLCSEKDGISLTNGSSILSVENFDFAKSRKVKILGELSEIIDLNCWKCTFEITEDIIDVYKHLLNLLLEKNGLKKDDIDLVIPTGEGTQEFDYYEAKALNDYFDGKKEFVYTPKSIIGNTMGACCGIDIIVALMCIQHDTVPAIPYSPKLLNNEFSNIFVTKTNAGKNIRNILVVHKNWLDGKISGVVVSKFRGEDEIN